MAKPKSRYICQACGSVSAPLAGAVRRLRRMEHARPGDRPRCRASSPPSTICQGGGRVDPAGRARNAARRCPSGCRAASPSSTARSAAASSPARRCWSAAIPASASRRCCSRSRRGWRAQGSEVVYVSGEESAEQVRLRAVRLGLGAAPVRLAAATSVRDILTTVGEATPPALLVIDSIQTMHSRPDRGRARHRQPGPRLGAGTGALRQGAWHRGRARRPCHQGRHHRRPARARAYGRHGAELRGRAQPPVPNPPRDEEPLRRHRRDRRVRDGRARG